MERRNFLKMLGFGAAAAVPGATLFGNEVLDEAAEKAGVSQETLDSIKKLDPPSETDALIAEHWAKESLNILHENMVVSERINKNYKPLDQGDCCVVTGDELRITTDNGKTYSAYDVVACCTVTGICDHGLVIHKSGGGCQLEDGIDSQDYFRFRGIEPGQSPEITLSNPDYEWEDDDAVL